MLYASSHRGDLLFVTIIPNIANRIEDEFREAYQELHDYLKASQTVLLQERVYAPIKYSDLVHQTRGSILEPIGEAAAIPITYVEGSPVGEMKWAGIHAIAVRPDDKNQTRLLERNGFICGRIYEGKEARHLSLSDVGRLLKKRKKDCTHETEEIFKVTQSLLQEHDWSYNNVCRTWFYLDDILEWYDEFNQIRNQVYNGLGLFNGQAQGVIPASTGIEGKNPREGCCTLDLLAMKPLQNHSFQIQRLVNPKQNEALEYGSAFSRGLSIAMDQSDYLFVSGTASIDEHGVTVYKDDVRKQVLRTMENIEALISSHGAGLQDLTQLTVFVKYKDDIDVFYELADQMGCPKERAVCMIADVCRDDLLFEIDGSAVLPK